MKKADAAQLAWRLAVSAADTISKHDGQAWSVN